ncbi:MAG: hypothetical protein ABEN55_13190, partial [Bradymonadaceae bacterium]
MKEQSANLIQRIDELLQDRQLDEVADELVDLLTPSASDPWPDVEVVLHLAEHEAVAEDLRKHGIPDELEQAIGEALEAVFPMLGIRPYGPTFKLVDIARRRLDAETEKFELVVDKLDEISTDERVAMVERYLGTEPAPMFVNRMRQLYPEVVSEATEALEDEGEARVRLEALVERLGQLQADDDWTPEAVAETLASVDRPEEVASLGLASDHPDEQFAGAAVMYARELDDLVPTAIRLALDGTGCAPELAVLTSQIAPERARNSYSTFIAEVTWQNPELPEAELTEARIRAILSARSVLPRL